MDIVVTGSAGFIGCEVALQLLARGDTVSGIDNVNDYYDTRLKRARLQRLLAQPGYRHHEFCIADGAALHNVFRQRAPRRVIHLAAQAGVRYSLENPAAYLSSNLAGFGNILEACRQHGVEHLVYASSSSVYGANTRQPFAETDNVDHPVSLYAATKKSNELMAHAYSHLFRLPTTGLRFFTVYGPWGRPDMAYFKFVKKILAGEPIEIYNHGHHRRDFTYIDDIVRGVILTCDRVATANPGWSGDTPDPATSNAPYRLYNIGNNTPVELLHFIELIEQNLGIEAKKKLLPMQPGDVPDTYADVSALMRDVGYRPDTPIAEGVRRFVQWYREYYRNA
jgi:UDP-glucuronate 4-epimerase